MMRPHLSALNRCCITRRRPFSTTLSQAEPSQYAPYPAEAGYARLTNRGLISITGLDSATFLQGLITQNMLVGKPPNKTVRHTGSYAAFLNSQGRILNDAFIYPLSNADGNVEWLVEVDKNEVVTLLKHLKKHKLRAKLKLRAIEDGERTVWSSWKSHSQPRWEEYSMDSESVPPFAATSDVTGCIDSRTPGFGSRIVTPGSEDLRSHFLDETQLAGSEVALDSYTVRRILNGVAEGQGEIIRESALPLEYNMDMGRAIDFRKGCYVGQELTIRTHHTGIVRKRVLPVQFYTDTLDLTEGPAYDPSAQLSLPPSGSNIMKAGASRGRSAGKVLNSVGNIGLALCRLEMMTDVALTGEATQYNPGSEFKVSWATETEKSEVKLQTFIPQWTRDFIYNGGVRKQAPQPIDDGERARVLVEHLDEEEQLRKQTHL